jgi:hypothetical protein
VVPQRPPAPEIDDFEFYPGTGADDVMEMNIVNAPLMPLWKYVHPRRGYSTSSSLTFLSIRFILGSHAVEGKHP